MRNYFIISFLFVLFIGSGILYSQPKPPSKERRLKYLAKELNLTQEQKDKIKTILKTSQEEMENIREKKEEQDKQFMDEIEKIISSEDEQIIKLLNDDQKKKYNEMKEKRRQHPPMPDDKGMPFKVGPGNDRGREGDRRPDSEN